MKPHGWRFLQQSSCFNMSPKRRGNGPHDREKREKKMANQPGASSAVALRHGFKPTKLTQQIQPRSNGMRIIGARHDFNKVHVTHGRISKEGGISRTGTWKSERTRPAMAAMAAGEDGRYSLKFSSDGIGPIESDHAVIKASPTRPAISSTKFIFQKMISAPH